VKAPSDWFHCTAGASGDRRNKATHQARCAVYNLLQAQSREGKQGLRQTDQEAEECKYHSFLLHFLFFFSGACWPMLPQAYHFTSRGSVS